MPSFIVEINEAASKCQHSDYRDWLRAVAARLYTATQDFKLYQNRETMQALVAAWTRAHILMRDRPPAPGEDKPEVPGSPAPCSP